MYRDDERSQKFIRRILRKGDALLQKTVTTDFLNKKRVANKDIVPQYYVENSHEAIIPRHLFMLVQEEVDEYDEALVTRLIEKITVYDDHLAFEFKSGLETEVQM